MKLSSDAIIAKEKIVNYLLQWQPENDKSKFLAFAGYEKENWKLLEEDIRKQLLSLNATLIEQTRFGDVFEIRGTLIGPNKIFLNVISVWMFEYKTQQSKFITLFPDKEK